jgi:hypothetical protein
MRERNRRRPFDAPHMLYLLEKCSKVQPTPNPKLQTPNPKPQTPNPALISSRNAPRFKFSNVSSLVYFLYNVTVEEF